MLSVSRIVLFAIEDANRAQLSDVTKRIVALPPVRCAVRQRTHSSDENI